MRIPRKRPCYSTNQSKKVIFEVLKYGFFYGSFIGLVALGFSLIYNVIHVIDFAYTDRLVLSGYVFLSLLGHVNQFLAGLVAVFVAVIFSILSEYLLYKKVRKINPKLLLLTTFGFSIILQNSLAIIFSDNLKEYPFFEQTIRGTNLYYREVVIVPFLILFCFGLFYWLKKSKTGIALRACISNFEKSKTLGISSENLFLLVFLFSGLLAGFGGIYLSMGFGLTPYSGFKIMIFAFSSCLIAGLDNIYGSVLIGILFGLFLSLFEAFFNALVAEAVSLSIFLVILIFFPSGIFGKKLRII